MKKPARSATAADTPSAKNISCMPIYTRTGDTGSTSLFGGKRVLKCEELVDVYGSIDELNSWVGLIATQIEAPDVQQFLQTIQTDLFTIGSHLAGWPARNASASVAGGKTQLSHLGGRVKEMEARIDLLEKALPKLTNFIIPGGTQLGAFVHVTRGICRRVERQAVSLAQKETVDSHIIKYLNRLSDLLFMLARFINNEAHMVEVTWSGIDRSGKKK